MKIFFYVLSPSIKKKMTKMYVSSLGTTDKRRLLAANISSTPAPIYATFVVQAMCSKQSFQIQHLLQT